MHDEDERLNDGCRLRMKAITVWKRDEVAETWTTYAGVAYIEVDQ